MPSLQPPVSIPALIIDLLSLAWTAYQFVQGRIEEVQFQIAVEKLRQTVAQLKAARTPQEKSDANKRIITDVINRL